jgi:3-phosphoshikimate 1-carboxyvinyltransferase
VAPGPLDATVRLPGSKSLTARYLVLAALADGPSAIRGALRARDTELMAAALNQLGARAAFAPAAAGWDALVSPGALRGGQHLEAGLAGTVMRFAAPLAALAEGRTQFRGDPAAAARPIEPLLEALRQLGAGAGRPGEAAGGDRAALFWVEGPARRGGPVTLDARASSQFASALLLAGPRFERGLELSLAPAQLPSRPHVEMTVEALRAFGAQAQPTGEFAWRVAPGPLAGRDIAVEPDLTSAAPFLAAALVAGGTVRVAGWPRRTTQAGRLMLDCVEAFGGRVGWDGAALAVTGAGPIRGVDLDLSQAGELVPAVAALAALATSPSRLDGIGHLRGHETDRLAALAREIAALGGRAEATADGLKIWPGRLRGAELRTYGDHRMAMFGAVVGLGLPGVVLDDVGVTSKTFPDFAQAWEALA